MRNRIICFLIAVFLITESNAQSIWNIEHLNQVRQSIDQPFYSAVYKQLLEEAEHEMQQKPLSVMMKDKIPASGNKHDYMSQARYYWPDSTKTDGKPYISHDGISNPELKKLDRIRLGQMSNGVITLSLAYYFSKEEKYARKATELVRTWFLNKDTRMNPNLNYAQVIPGRFKDKGRCYGIIDTYSFINMLEAIQLLEDSDAFTPTDSKQLKAWFRQLLKWLLNSKQGKEESRQKNNHSIAYDAQIISFSLYIGDKETAKKVILNFAEKRIFKQIEPNGEQPLELKRTLAFGYSQFNISHMTDVFLMAKKLGISIDNMTSEDGRNFYKAVDFLAKHMSNNSSKWPYQQIADWNIKLQEFCKDLYRIHLLNPSKKDYLRLFKQYRKLDWNDWFFLLYYIPEETDDAYSSAIKQLKYALGCVNQAKQITNDTTLVSPRSLEKDGSIRLVAPKDWCFGFFPGSLWQLYAYTNDSYWKEEAEKYTHPIEKMKNYNGTHDLGFILNCSFGQGYRLTKDKNYRDILIQASRTLSSRYSSKVKAIRSWDWNKEVWQYPVIIDNMLNLELLFWAYQETGDSLFYQIAVNHANTTLKNHFRKDNSSYHVVDYDSITGNVRSKETHQGYDDASIWSRGQAWGIYGYTMCYRYTKNPAYLMQAEKIVDFFFNQSNLPADLIPYWDMKDPAIPNAPRDASAAAVIASALYELCQYTDVNKSMHYKTLADHILRSLSGIQYQANFGSNQGFLLLHSTGNYPKNDEIDVPLSYADYYYLEALTRKTYIEP